MLLCPDASPLEADEGNPGLMDLGTRIDTRLATELQRGEIPAFLGLSPAAAVPILRRVAVVKGSSLLMSLLLESNLETSGIERLEVLIHMRAMNASQPKTLYRR
jgi:hypothetical protein